ncbi:MAG TPA: family 78 glycoside hydrolase catalytic domain [Terriglobia bacterium]|nr:family 78 glycoside hydrolase catalytic domain [Terriglobia bacterium]
MNRIRVRLQIILLSCLLLLASSSHLIPQQISPALLEHRWRAHWISYPGGPQREFAVFRFRKTFSLATIPRHFIIHASGDNRYQLFVNGHRVLEGPARGDLDHWRFETTDLAPHLRAGTNVLAAVAWNFAELAPMAQMSNESGFILQGDNDAEAVIDTDKSWKSFRDRSVDMMPVGSKTNYAYTVVGPGESVDGARYPWGWETRDFDDSAWSAAAEISPGAPRAIQDSPSRWMLVPRSIPLMEETLQRFNRIVRTGGVEATPEFLHGHAPITVGAETHATILLDQAFLTTGYPELQASGGRGAEISLTYAESLWKGRDKGNRNETEGKEIKGYQDRFLPDGGEHRIFRPLWWRTFRYIQLDIQTHSEPLVLADFRSSFTAYPFTVRAQFESDDPTLSKIWDVGWRTARLCAHETYMDCPYYEQLQYAGDTRIQALISLYMTGDDRLVKNAIELLDESRTPDGLTQSRYPSALPQYIPPFSLLWIGMMHDLWWYHGDAKFLRQFQPGMSDVLGWFESRLTPSGLLGRLQWWDFADWTKDFEDGVPHQDAGGQSAILSLQFALALKDAADMEDAFGNSVSAAHHRALADKIVEGVRKTCWDPTRQLIADTPAHQHFSQHANVLAVLAGAVPMAESKKLMRTVLGDKSLTQCSYYFRFYLFRAMKRAGLGDEYLNQLGPWRHMLDLGLTTWAETPEPTRSDCHAWSAHPNFDLLATVAGIESAAPGFAKVRIEPHLGDLHHLQATLPLPSGEIKVAYLHNQGSLVADVTLPQHLTGWFAWHGKIRSLHGGRQHLAF